MCEQQHFHMGIISNYFSDALAHHISTILIWSMGGKKYHVQSKEQKKRVKKEA